MRKRKQSIIFISILLLPIVSCTPIEKKELKKKKMTAKEILGNPSYQAISYGGYRTKTRKDQPTIEQLKEDMRIIHAMGIRLLRTYNVHLPHASNLLAAIKSLQQENQNFEMYLMLGAWIDCKNAWTEMEPDHFQESEQNEKEIAKVVALANKYPEIVKIIAVGNEAMVKWATSYYVQPGIILKWVNHLQLLKENGALPKDLWVTSSDDFASWGGGSDEYHVDDLNKLIRAVDFISMHSYPMHNTHYNPYFWGILENLDSLPDGDQIENAMLRSRDFAIEQYQKVKEYTNSIGIEKPIHIGETGWASFDNHLYGKEGSKAADEYKAGRYYQLMREWSNENKITCFFFEAFDEVWKDATNDKGCENFFGIFTLDGKAKYAIWDLVDQNVFKGLERSGNPITKTYNGSLDQLFEDVMLPPKKEELTTSK